MQLGVKMAVWSSGIWRPGVLHKSANHTGKLGSSCRTRRLTILSQGRVPCPAQHCLCSVQRSSASSATAYLGTMQANASTYSIDGRCMTTRLLVCRDAVTALAWSRDGRWLATGSLDKTVCLWNVLSNTLVCPTLTRKRHGGMCVEHAHADTA